MKKRFLLVLAPVACVLAAVLLLYSVKPQPKAEAMSVWGGPNMIEIICDACKDQLDICCEKLCYDSIARGHTVSPTLSRDYHECVLQCLHNLASLCRSY